MFSKNYLNYFFFTLLVLIGGSCGTTGNNSLNLGLSGWNQDANAIISQYINRYSCERRSAVYFSVRTNYGSVSTIGGYFSPGALSGGVTGSYLGVNSYTGDLMVVNKVVSGYTVVGYNVQLSFCTNTQASAGYRLNERNISQFVAPYGITLIDPTNSPMGVVAIAQNTYVMLDSANVTCNYYGGYSYSGTCSIPAAYMYTSYATPPSYY